MSVKSPTVRQVEHEIRPIDWKNLELPKVDTRPLREMGEAVLYTSLGLGLLAARGVRRVLLKAYRAGKDTYSSGSSPAQSKVRDTTSVNVPVMRVAGYAAMDEHEAINALNDLDAASLRAVEAYERAHAARPGVLAVIADRLKNA
ncbi:MAG: hypothetical protein GXY52_11385 [Chloroflexi bacterium]|nr:hypothetical protein [Chloroflexota bacterium]